MDPRPPRSSAPGAPQAPPQQIYGPAPGPPPYGAWWTAQYPPGVTFQQGLAGFPGLPGLHITVTPTPTPVETLPLFAPEHNYFAPPPPPLNNHFGARPAPRGPPLEETVFGAGFAGFEDGPAFALPQSQLQFFNQRTLPTPVNNNGNNGNNGNHGFHPGFPGLSPLLRPSYTPSFRAPTPPVFAPRPAAGVIAAPVYGRPYLREYAASPVQQTPPPPAQPRPGAPIHLGSFHPYATPDTSPAPQIPLAQAPSRTPARRTHAPRTSMSSETSTSSAATAPPPPASASASRVRDDTSSEDEREREERRQQRKKEINAESARRSRQRKQERIAALEGRARELADELEGVRRAHEAALGELADARGEVERLRRENEELRARLGMQRSGSRLRNGSEERDDEGGKRPGDDGAAGGPFAAGQGARRAATG